MSNSDFLDPLHQGRIQGGVFGVNPPPHFGKFFQFAKVFKKKIPKSPKFSRSYKKKIQNPSLEKFLDTPHPLVTEFKCKKKITIACNKISDPPSP